MDKCHACKSKDVDRERNSLDHFKPSKGKPIRVYRYRCNECGFVATYAKTPEQEVKSDGKKTGQTA